VNFVGFRLTLEGWRLSRYYYSKNKGTEPTYSCRFGTKMSQINIFVLILGWKLFGVFSLFIIV